MKVDTANYTNINQTIPAAAPASDLSSINNSTIDDFGINITITNPTKLETASSLYDQYKSLYFNNSKDPNIQNIANRFFELTGVQARPPLKKETADFNISDTAYPTVNPYSQQIPNKSTVNLSL